MDMDYTYRSAEFGAIQTKMSIKIASSTEIRRDWVKADENLYLDKDGVIYIIRDIYPNVVEDILEPTLNHRISEVDIVKVADELFCGV